MTCIRTCAHISIASHLTQRDRQYHRHICGHEPIEEYRQRFVGNTGGDEECDEDEMMTLHQREDTTRVRLFLKQQA